MLKEIRMKLTPVTSQALLLLLLGTEQQLAAEESIGSQTSPKRQPHPSVLQTK